MDFVLESSPANPTAGFNVLVKLNIPAADEIKSAEFTLTPGGGASLGQAVSGNSFGGSPAANTVGPSGALSYAEGTTGAAVSGNAVLLATVPVSVGGTGEYTFTLSGLKAKKGRSSRTVTSTPLTVTVSEPQGPGPCTAANWAAGAWGACSAECGGGTQTRTYSKSGGCSGGVAKPQDETRACNEAACASPCTVDSWATPSAWGDCSAPCGGGTQTRTVSKKADNAGCTGNVGKPVESQACNAQPCAVCVTNEKRCSAGARQNCNAGGQWVDDACRGDGETCYSVGEVDGLCGDATEQTADTRAVEDAGLESGRRGNTVTYNPATNVYSYRGEEIGRADLAISPHRVLSVWLNHVDSELILLSVDEQNDADASGIATRLEISYDPVTNLYSFSGETLTRDADGRPRTEAAVQAWKTRLDVLGEGTIVEQDATKLSLLRDLQNAMNQDNKLAFLSAMVGKLKCFFTGQGCPAGG